MQPDRQGELRLATTPDVNTDFVAPLYTPHMSPGCPLCITAAQCEQRSHPLHIATLTQCHVLLGENQGCEGWCVCVLREHAEHLDALTIERQQAIFAEVAVVSRAIREWSLNILRSENSPSRPATAPRINYECLGNVVPHIHWHVIPRHASIDPELRRPVWGWPQEQLLGTQTHDERVQVASDIRDCLEKLIILTQ